MKRRLRRKTKINPCMTFASNLQTKKFGVQEERAEKLKRVCRANHQIIEEVKKENTKEDWTLNETSVATYKKNYETQPILAIPLLHAHYSLSPYSLKKIGKYHK